MKTNKTAESLTTPPASAPDGVAGDGGTGQDRPEQSPHDNAGTPASGRPARGSSLGYATAHLGSASVAGLGAIGSAYGLGGVAVAGGLLAGSAASAYVARRVTRVGGRRTAGGGRSALRPRADGTKVRRGRVPALVDYKPTRVWGSRALSLVVGGVGRGCVSVLGAGRWGRCRGTRLGWCRGWGLGSAR